MQKFIAIISLVLGLITGISGTLLFKGSMPKCNSQSPVIFPTIQQTAVMNNRYKITVDSLQKTNSVLDKRISFTKGELQKEKCSNKILMELVDTLIAHANGADDTANKLMVCDSLTETVQELMASSIQKDSLYENLSFTYQSQVENRDSVIQTQQEAYHTVRIMLDASVTQQQLLFSQNQLYEKQRQRHVIKNKVLSAGVFVLTGIAAYSLLHH